MTTFSILCFEVFAKAQEAWTVRYVKPSKAETDVPDSAVDLICQRRKWITGSFAACVYTLRHFGQGNPLIAAACCKLLTFFLSLRFGTRHLQASTGTHSDSSTSGVIPSGFPCFGWLVNTND